MGPGRRPLKPHHLAAAVVGHGELLLVGTIYMAVTKIQHLIIACKRETGLLEKSRISHKTTLHRFPSFHHMRSSLPSSLLLPPSSSS